MLLSVNLTTLNAQEISIGVTIRSVHTSKPKTIKRYNNWNPGVVLKYKNKNNVTFTSGILLNSWKKLSWISGVGYQIGDFEAQLGGATGYKHLTGYWMIPGYFVNYFGKDIVIRANHKVVNFGANINTIQK